MMSARVTVNTDPTRNADRSRDAPERADRMSTPRANDRAHDHRLEQGPLEERRPEAVEEGAHRRGRSTAARTAPAAPSRAKPAVSVSTTMAPEARRTPW